MTAHNLPHVGRPATQWIIVLLAIVVLPGCASAPKPTRITAIITTGPAVNPGTDGRAAPVVVRVYGLKTLDPFRSADFFALYEDDRKTLGASLLYREEQVMNPGQTWQLQAELPSGVRYLGAIAAFREIDQARWRAVAPLRTGKKNRVGIHIGSRQIEFR